MRVLFITVSFREYIGEICNAIKKELQAEVDLMNLTVELPLLIRLLDKIVDGRILYKHRRRQQKKQFNFFSKKQYDYVFVLVGRNVEVDLLKRFFDTQKKAKKILYVWDDIARINTFKKMEYLYDEIFSFDSRDCQQYGFTFLPLFYCPYYLYEGEHKDIDLSCIGALHSDREAYLKRISKFCVLKNFSNYFHLQTARTSILKDIIKCTRKNIPSFIRYNEVSMVDSSNILRRSVCVVDMPHPTQTGLTIRTIEALASQTKIITTNKAIKDYDFYNENNILITDTNCSNLTEEFIRKPYVKIEDSIIGKYSLNSWVRAIFKGD